MSKIFNVSHVYRLNLKHIDEEVKLQKIGGVKK
jgi:hypothetical protein